MTGAIVTAAPIEGVRPGDYLRISGEKRRAVVTGVTRSMLMYELTPFWWERLWAAIMGASA